MRIKPLYKEIYAELERKILTGELTDGDKISTEMEIVEKYSVSRITAKRVMEDLARDGYIERKRRLGSFVKSNRKTIAPSSAQRMKTDDMLHLALVSPFPPEGFDLFKNIIQNADDNRIIPSMYITENSIEKEATVLENLLKYNLGGLIMAPIERRENSFLYHQFRKNGVPVVFIDRHLPWLDIPYVSTNNYKAMYDLTEWVIGQGYKDIAFLGNFEVVSVENNRLRGFMQALMDNGLTQDSRWLHFLEAEPNNKINYLVWREERILEYFKILQRMNALPEVIMCINDELASVTMKVCAQLNFNVPGDISITGFDNSSLYNTVNEMLTTVDQNYTALGNLALNLLLDVKNGKAVPSEQLIDIKIIIRDSVRRSSDL